MRVQHGNEKNLAVVVLVGRIFDALFVSDAFPTASVMVCACAATVDLPFAGTWVAAAALERAAAIRVTLAGLAPPNSSLCQSRR
jgi:hypothetical protein